jgi:rhodanese-related sulfurtransferase
MKTRIFIVLAIAALIVSVMAIGTATADGSFESITAQQASDMALDPSLFPPEDYDPDTNPGKGYLVDIRTTEEYYWVGNPANADGNPIAFNIPWELWSTSRIKPDGAYYKPAMLTVEWLFRLYIRSTFGRPDVPQLIGWTHKAPPPLIIMCRSGKRTGDPYAKPGDGDYRAGNYLAQWGYEVYEIDRSDKNGRGGFQGSASNCPAPYVGYRGWPGRCTVADDPVSWMDTGLPITQKIDPCLVWCYKWRY